MARQLQLKSYVHTIRFLPKSKSHREFCATPVGLWEAQEEADRSTICVTIKGRSLLNESLTSEEKRGKHKN